MYTHFILCILYPLGKYIRIPNTIYVSLNIWNIAKGKFIPIGNISEGTEGEIFAHRKTLILMLQREHRDTSDPEANSDQ
jgi:hypothetical protein